jgi:hypothetical protein
MKVQLLVLLAALAITVSTKAMGDTCYSVDDCADTTLCCA